MPRTKVIYEDPSGLSQGLVIGLSVTIVAMAAWFGATVANSRTAATTTGQAEIEGNTDAAMSASGAPASDGADTSPQQTSIHFDWPNFTTVPTAPRKP